MRRVVVGGGCCERAVRCFDPGVQISSMRILTPINDVPRLAGGEIKTEHCAHSGSCLDVARDPST